MFIRYYALSFNFWLYLVHREFILYVGVRICGFSPITISNSLLVDFIRDLLPVMRYFCCFLFSLVAFCVCTGSWAPLWDADRECSIVWQGLVKRVFLFVILEEETLSLFTTGDDDGNSVAFCQCLLPEWGRCVLFSV